MPISLIPDAGAANANTYADLAYYKDFIATRRPRPSWTSLALGSSIDANLIVDLIAAAKLLDAGFIWTGQATFATQARIAPRIGWLNRNGFAIDPLIVANEMKDAQCEMAVQLHDSDVAAEDEAGKAGVKRVKADTVEVEFQDVSDSLESVSAVVRRKESKFSYLTMPVKVRLLLVPSWYVESSINRGAIFEVL